MRVVFSKDRPAQLDLLLRSLETFAPPEPTTVIYTFSKASFEDGYEIAAGEHPSVRFERERKYAGFAGLLAAELADAADTVAFFCDDNVLLHEIDDTPTVALEEPQVLAFSLRLGGLPNVWDWTVLEPHDRGYPGSIDGHVFRTADVLRMIAGQPVADPLALETALALRVHDLAAERPLMGCYPVQALVGVNVNTVATTGGVRAGGRRFPQSADELNRRFLAGGRISLDTLASTSVEGCLVEVPFRWEQAA